MSNKPDRNKLYRFSEDEKAKLIEDYVASKQTVKEYCKSAPMCSGSLHRWLKEHKTKATIKKRQYSPTERKTAVEEFLKSGLTQQNFAKVWGIDSKTLHVWYRIYKEFGPKRLLEGPIYKDGKRGRKEIHANIKDKIIETKTNLPKHGLKKLQHILGRFEGIAVSVNTIKKVLVKNELYTPPQPPPKKNAVPQIRRFERATPMQLWQSDITSYVLKRSGQRAYLVVFKDDHSRFVVSWALALQQTGDFVIQCLLDGIQKYGLPKEVLTDQGRQYFSWRGKSEFQKLLESKGIRHVVARSHHPQTLGKCERLWKTINTEFWERARPQELQEAQKRLTHYFNHFNHFRPHQGINGSAPADRFFGIENDVRKILEETMSENELRLSIDEKPRKPVYLVGQIDGQQVSMHGEKGKLIFNTPDGIIQELNYDNFGNGNAGRGGHEGSSEESGSTPQTGTQEEEVQSSEDANTRACSMGNSESRGTTNSAFASDSDNGILDGPFIEDGGIQEVGSSPSENLADGTDGVGGNVCRTIEATENQEYGDDRQGQRPNGTKEENQGDGEDHRHAREADLNSSLDAGLYASGLSKNDGRRKENELHEGDRDKNRSEAWREEAKRSAEDTIQQLKLKWQSSLWKKGEK